MAKLQNKKILLIGIGGHGKSILDSLLSLGQYQEIGLVDSKNFTDLEEQWKLTDGKYQGCRIYQTGNDHDLSRLFFGGFTEAFIGIGSIGDVSVRRHKYETLKRIGFSLPYIIDPSAVISPFAVIDEGVFIGKQAVVNVHTKIGACAIINTAAVLEHDCSIGDFVHVAPGSILSGNVTVKADTHIGAGSMIKQSVTIGEQTIIGMGSVVLKDLGSHLTAYGNPCKEVKHE